MTEDEQEAAINNAAKIMAAGDSHGVIFWIDEARESLAPMFAKIAALEAENCALRSNNQTLDQVMSDISGDLGCSCDNEKILEAIDALRRRLVIDDAMITRACMVDLKRATNVRNCSGKPKERT